MGKNIINATPTVQPTKTLLNKTQSDKTSTEPVMVHRDDTKTNITIDNRLCGKLNWSPARIASEVYYLLTGTRMRCPKDCSEPIWKLAKEAEVPSQQRSNFSISNINAYSRIGVFMDQNTHYTGGRYSIYMQLVMLSQYYNVTLITNKEVPFKGDFSSYGGYDKLQTIVRAKDWLLNEDFCRFDIVIGIPNVSGVAAWEYSKKFNIPFVGYMFESPNYVAIYRSGPDATEEFWASYKKALADAVVRISPSKTSSKYLKEWLDCGEDDESFKVVYPCINMNVANTVLQRILSSGSVAYPDYSSDVVISTRMANFKKPDAIFKALDSIGFDKTVHVIGKVWDADASNWAKYNTSKGLKVKIHGQVDDTEKFKIISSCKLLIHPSMFEGFGMPPMEALYFGKPVIAYDLPVLREAYADMITLVNRGKADQFAQAIMDHYANPQEHHNQVPEWVNPYNCVQNLINCIVTEERVKVCAGMIAFNSIDYIKEAINSIYDIVDHIVIVEGAVIGNEETATVEGHSTDGTYEWLKNDDGLQDPFRKIFIIAKKNGFWLDKIEMQNKIAEKVDELGCGVYVKVDSDEVWNRNTLRDVINAICVDKTIDIIAMPFVHLWTSFSYKAVDAGGKWSTKHPRVWRWKQGYRHQKSFNYFVDTNKDSRVVGPPHQLVLEWQGEPIYHFGYARKLSYVQQKLKYYANRKIEKNVNVSMYEKWSKLEDSTQPTQLVRSWAEPFDKSVLPKIMVGHPYWLVEDIRRLP